MNFYLLQVIGKWITFTALSIATSLGFYADETTIEINNENSNKNISILADVTDYESKKTYDSSIPSNISKVLTEGTDGLTFYDVNGNVVYQQNVINEEVLQGTGRQGIYKGILTGYGPDCSTCSGKGFVSCRTLEKESFNLLTDGIYYNDSEYGKARVLAAALTMFPCGTIIEVKNSNSEDFIGIVLDTGFDMRKNLNNGVYHFDVAFQSEEDEMVAKTTNTTGTVIFSVQRWGW